MDRQRDPIAVRRILIGILLINLAVTAIKFIVGALSGSLAVLADAFNSLIDSAANVIGLIGVHAASEPPDADHPYGHRRYETLATLAIGALLLLAGWEVLRNVFDRLIRGGVSDAQPVGFVLILSTVPINLFVAWFEGRRGRELQSDVLLADATQTRVNLLTTLAALAGLISIPLGLPWLDLVFALGITLVIGREAWRILRATATVLSDHAAIDPDHVQQMAQQVPGVRFATHVRSRGRDDDIHLDLHIKVNPAMSTMQAHAIASEVEHRLTTRMKGVVDAVVHIEPGQQPAPTRQEAIAVQVRAIADGLGFGAHNLHIHPGKDGYALDVDVEVDASLSLEESHRQVTTFEKRVYKTLADVAEVVTHIEPAYTPSSAEVPADDEVESLKARIVEVGDRVCGTHATHHVLLRRINGRYDASLHVIAPGNKSVVESHLLAEEVERQLRDAIDRLDQITVHVEPPEGRDD